MQNNAPSISKFCELVELKDDKPPTKKEYVRCVRRLGDHAGCDPAVLSEDQVRACFLFPRQEKEFSGWAMSGDASGPRGGACLACAMIH